MRNVANGDGGGVCSQTDAGEGFGSLAISRSFIMYNTADADRDGTGLGGGIWWYDDSVISPTLRNNLETLNRPDQIHHEEAHT